MEWPISLDKLSYWLVGIVFILYSTYHLIIMNNNYNIVIDKKKLSKNINIIGLIMMLLMLLRIINTYNSL